MIAKLAAWRKEQPIGEPFEAVLVLDHVAVRKVPTPTSGGPNW